MIINHAALTWVFNQPNPSSRLKSETLSQIPCHTAQRRGLRMRHWLCIRTLTRNGIYQATEESWRKSRKLMKNYDICGKKQDHHWTLAESTTALVISFSTEKLPHLQMVASYNWLSLHPCGCSTSSTPMIIPLAVIWEG